MNELFVPEEFVELASAKGWSCVIRSSLSTFTLAAKR